MTRNAKQWFQLNNVSSFSSTAFKFHTMIALIELTIWIMFELSRLKVEVTVEWNANMVFA